EARKTQCLAANDGQSLVYSVDGNANNNPGKQYMKGWIAAALMVLPLLIAVAIGYWPTRAVAVATVVIPPPDVHGRTDISELAKDLPAMLAERLREAAKLHVNTAGERTEQ